MQMARELEPRQDGIVPMSTSAPTRTAVGHTKELERKEQLFAAVLPLVLESMLVDFELAPHLGGAQAAAAKVGAAKAAEATTTTTTAAGEWVAPGPWAMDAQRRALWRAAALVSRATHRAVQRALPTLCAAAFEVTVPASVRERTDVRHLRLAPLKLEAAVLELQRRYLAACRRRYRFDETVVVSYIFTSYWQVRGAWRTGVPKFDHRQSDGAVYSSLIQQLKFRGLCVQFFGKGAWDEFEISRPT